MDNSDQSVEFIPLPTKAKDITGQRFGRLIAIGPVSQTKHKGIKWLVRCDCGGQKVILAHNLVCGLTKSCGCLQRDWCSLPKSHGKSRSRLYHLWNLMLSRVKSSGRKNYFGRGITVCQEWQESFEAFDSCVSALPHCGEKGYSLDRINNDGNYEPGNVRWATSAEQSRNTRRTRLFTFNGKTQCVVDWCRECNMSNSAFYGRLRSGWTIEEILTTPVNASRQSRKER